MVVVYGYWYQTNDRRILRKTERYLRELTGGRVKIHRASFSFFGGIELEGVRLYVPGVNTPVPFIRAERVFMRHHPWGLLVAGHVKPREIVCSNPVVTWEYGSQLGAYSSLQRLLAVIRERKKNSPPNWRMELPPIRVRQGRLVVVDVEGDNRVLVGEVPIEISMVPRGEEHYVITFEETPDPGQEAMQGKVIVDLAAGKVTQVSGVLPLESLSKTLPRRYRIWRDRYNLKGDIRVKRSSATRPMEINADNIL